MRTSLFLAIVAAFLTAGCVTVFPKAEPARLYKLSPEVALAEPSGAPVMVVQKGPTSFARAAAGDSIITVTGSEVAAIAGARWAAPVQLQFDEALVAAFDAAPDLRLVTRGALGVQSVLRVEVRTFEARYLEGQQAPPTVVIEARADLTRLTDTRLSADQVFRAEAAASENRVGAIVQAYDAATADLLRQIVAWTEQQSRRELAQSIPAMRLAAVTVF